jgi:hypothetical protein
MVLGQRFKVLILPPLIVLVGLLAFCAALVRADAIWSTAATAAVVIASLQIGYLLGMAIRVIMVLARAVRTRTRSLAEALPPRHRAIEYVQTDGMR